ncbi:MAG TPA: hypothetical protein VE954_37425 [Oligoflexus sp.]|uniref:hypothetical protein n=1 Tax=Oligoflexus sp. TaxID=1971216 RepID=UPI002D537590|nr:hypothetical protein [Oligoflexus sp.]HYX38822.1 hypothetical protein [Oligoflexus sp.]
MVLRGSVLKMDSKRMRLLLKKKADELTGDFGYYPNEVQPALRFAQKILDGKRTGALISPFQSGKTNIIACIFFLLKGVFPDIKGIVVCANDQVDLRSQNNERLEHIPGLKVLSRSDRQDWAESSDLMIVFYDENHFGDGINMTINDFFEKHKVKTTKNIFFCGVSATPFTSLDCLEFEEWPNLDELEKAGYNSPRMMLKNGRFQEADELFVRQKVGDKVRVQVNSKSKVCRHIETILNGKMPSGYAMVRAKSSEAEILEEYLKNLYGERIFIKQWNMNNRDFSTTFFQQERRGIFTLVIVQQKARMGNTIDTRYCHFMYENANSSTIDTITQSFMGRACGFGKQDHKAIIYSHRDKAMAYDILINSDGKIDDLERFTEFCRRLKLRPAARASLNTRVPEYELELMVEKTFHGRTKPEAIEVFIRGELEKRGLKRSNGSVRTLSKTKIPARKKGRRAFDPTESYTKVFCDKDPGSWGAMVYDSYHDECKPNFAKTWKGIIVKIVVRTERPTGLKNIIGPTDKSLHPTFRRDVRGVMNDGLEA